MTTNKPRTDKVSVEVRRYFRMPETHWLAVVTTSRGYSYYCVWAGDQPSEGAVLAAWREDRKAFEPYYS